MEWQFHGNDEWVFGENIRGIVRWPIAEIYFNESSNDKAGGWIWFIRLPEKPMIRGVSYSLYFAVDECEEELKKLGLIKENDDGR